MSDYTDKIIKMVSELDNEEYDGLVKKINKNSKQFTIEVTPTKNFQKVSASLTVDVQDEKDENIHMMMEIVVKILESRTCTWLKDLVGKK